MADLDRKRRHVQEWLANIEVPDVRPSAHEQTEDMEEPPCPPKGAPPAGRLARRHGRTAESSVRPQPPAEKSRRGARPLPRELKAQRDVLSSDDDYEDVAGEGEDDEGLDLMNEIEEETRIISALKDQLRLQRRLLEKEYELQQQSMGATDVRVGGFASDAPSRASGRDSALGSLSASSHRSGSRNGQRR